MILVTGASGALAGLVLERLSGRDDVVAGTRRPDLLDLDAPVRAVDFDAPATLAPAFEGVDVLLLVSAGYAEDDVVIARHGAAIRAAVAAGVGHVVYTSLAGSGDHLTLAVAHRWTERALADAPLHATILRNGLYAEIPLTLGLLAAPEQRVGVLAGPWGDGRVSVVAREDLAGAAARVVAEAAEGGEHAGRTYELAGVEALSAADVAAVLGVAYEPTPLEPAWAALAERGLPPYQAAHAMSILSNLGAGMLAQPATDLPALLDAPPRPALSLMAAAAAQTIPLQT